MAIGTAIACLAISVIVTVWVLTHTFTFASDSETVMGETNTRPVERCDSERGCRHFAVVEFTTLEGGTHETSMRVDRDAPIGTEVAVRYLPEDPSKTLPDGPAAIAQVVMMILLGPVLLVGCVVALVRLIQGKVRFS